MASASLTNFGIESFIIPSNVTVIPCTVVTSSPIKGIFAATFHSFRCAMQSALLASLPACGSLWESPSNIFMLPLPVTGALVSASTAACSCALTCLTWPTKSIAHQAKATNNAKITSKIHGHIRCFIRAPGKECSAFTLFNTNPSEVLYHSHTFIFSSIISMTTNKQCYKHRCLLCPYLYFALSTIKCGLPQPLNPDCDQTSIQPPCHYGALSRKGRKEESVH